MNIGPLFPIAIPPVVAQRAGMSLAGKRLSAQASAIAGTPRPNFEQSQSAVIASPRAQSAHAQVLERKWCPDTFLKTAQDLKRERRISTVAEQGCCAILHFRRQLERLY
jgi:hypothetical protein